jgi:hypothetical protein
MMTMQLDLTAQLAAIPYGLAIALAVSFVGLIACVSRDQIAHAKSELLASYRRLRHAFAHRKPAQVIPMRPLEGTL